MGDFFKTPKNLIWVVQAESHFSLCFHYTESDDLIYYDPFGAQTDEYRLTIDLEKQFIPGRGAPGEIEGMIDQTLRTKWKHASIDWNGQEPIL